MACGGIGVASSCALLPGLGFRTELVAGVGMAIARVLPFGLFPTDEEPGAVVFECRRLGRVTRLVASPPSAALSFETDGKARPLPTIAVTVSLGDDL